MLPEISCLSHTDARKHFEKHIRNKLDFAGIWGAAKLQKRKLLGLSQNTSATNDLIQQIYSSYYHFFIDKEYIPGSQHLKPC